MIKLLLQLSIVLRGVVQNIHWRNCKVLRYNIDLEIDQKDQHKEKRKEQKGL